MPIESLTAVNTQSRNVLADLENHCSGSASHRASVMKKIILMYLSMKIKHLCRLRNLDKNTFSRHINKKIPLFRHE